MNYRFHAEASAEYEASIRYYRQVQPGLQKRFVAAFSNTRSAGA